MDEEEQQEHEGQLIVGTDDDEVLSGGPGDDTIIGGGGNDTLFGGGGNNLLQGGDGNDNLVGGSGDDTMLGGAGDDNFFIGDEFGNHVIVGGTEDQVWGDTVFAGWQEDIIVTFSGDGTGTITRGGDDPDAEVSFTEIERIVLGGGNDTVIIENSTNGTIVGGDGFDTLILPDPEDGEGAPQVFVTESSENDDGSISNTGYVIFADGSRLDFKSFEKVICFTPGTLIDTARGQVPVEELRAGDHVLTRDHGYQPLVWTGRRELPGDEIAAHPALAPVRIAAGALGANLPSRDLTVSPRHRMLISGARAELLFGEREVLVAAGDLVGLPGVTRAAPEGAVNYIHVMCARHEILRAEGAWSESFQPAAGVVNALEDDTRAELLALFPALARPEGRRAFAAARPVLRPAEVRTLFAA